MTTTTVGTSRPATAQEAVQTRAGTRLLFVDNIRVFLTILVILHHLMITCGPEETTVGTYRLQTAGMARAGRGFYAAAEQLRPGRRACGFG